MVSFGDFFAQECSDDDLLADFYFFNETGKFAFWYFISEEFIKLVKTLVQNLINTVK